VKVKVLWKLRQKLIVMISLRLSILTSQVLVCLGFYDAVISAFICPCIICWQLALLPLTHKVVIVLVTSVSMSVCNVITFKSLDTESFLLFCWYILRGYRQRRRHAATAVGMNGGMGKRDTWRALESDPIMEVQGTELHLFVCYSVLLVCTVPPSFIAA